MEIRGLGIINIRDLFGAPATSRMKKMDLVIRFEEWDSSREYDRLGLEEGTVEILGVRLPSPLIPVSPGRNLATIVEVAVRNHLLKQLGVHSAREFVERQGRRAEGGDLP
jgi:HPr kinase/phosphorylase